MTNAPIFILLNPQLGENIGAVARAMSNFGLSDLRIVSPRDGWPNPAAIAMAAHGEHLLEKAMVVDTLKDALTDITTLYATTPRTDVLNKPVFTPREAMQKIYRSPLGGEQVSASPQDDARTVGGKLTHNTPHVSSIAHARSQLLPPKGGALSKTAILFGPERAGLSNEDIVLADAIISIPVTEENPSLNIAQAAVVIAYEWFVHCHPGEGRDPCQATHLLPKYGTDRTSPFSPNPIMDVDPGLRRDDTATKAELEGLFEHAKELLDKVNYFREPNKTKLMWQHLRSIWVKSHLTSQEVRTLRGLLRALKRKMRDN